MAVTIKPIPTIKASTSKKPDPYCTVRTARPKRTITGRANGRLAKTPSIDPLLIDSALPKANTLKRIKVDAAKIMKIFGASCREIPLAMENTEPINAIGKPIRKT